MVKKTHSMDGFIPRRTDRQVGGHPDAKSHARNSATIESKRILGSSRASARKGVGLSRADIEASLKDIDTNKNGSKLAKRRRFGRKNKLTRKQIAKRIALLLLIVLISIGGWIGYRALTAGSNIFKGNILLGLTQSKPLKQDTNGRSNILVVGTSDDDPGHEASYLTDSIMVLSVDQKNKNAYMVSIPRDLEVKYGQACLTGYQGKINVYYNCVGGGGKNVKENQEALKKTGDFIGQQVLGLDIQYGVNVNYTVMRQLVNAVGGISITIESDDPNGQMDSNFDWKCGLGDYKVTRAERLRRCPPSGHFIDYPNGPVNLDAEHALYLAQARGDSAPTYGFAKSNFDREKNQQKIIKAIREKAFSIGVLANFTKVVGIIDSLGDNLRTTFDSSEFQTLVSLAKDTKSENIKSISLIDGDAPVMGGDAQPTAGRYAFGPLQALIKKKLSSDLVVSEAANIAVFNGSSVAGVAQTEADKLTAQNFTVATVDTAPAGTYDDVMVYQLGTGLPATKAKLEKIYGVKVRTTKPPVAVAAATNFVVIFGKARAAN